VYPLLRKDDIPRLMTMTANLDIGDRIVFWAKQFIGTPYDPDPLGEYVRRGVIVSDERVDCMYLVFRSVELALSSTPQEAIEEALYRRFFIRGIVKDGKVVNYDQRYKYAMDMILSNKWGRDVTGELGHAVYIDGSRRWDRQLILPKENADEWMKNLKSGDIIYFVKDVKKRVVGEIIGHMGIIENDGGTIYLIHASGLKKKGTKGRVKREKLSSYLKRTNFIGVKITRF
ncbi:MAG: hypothetical protein D6828_01970, partial [Nitrospirae bacterium]